MDKVAPNGAGDLDKLETLRNLNSKKEWINQNLYRLMYKQGLYILAYERIKSKPGNMTPEIDGETLDGTSLELINEIIEEMKTEKFQFQPVKTSYIPKANGKLRKLGIPSTRDKLVQEVMRMILETIYDSPQGAFFKEQSHGFRSGRSCHSALKDIQRNWSATNWLIEGDIKACFDDIDHEILVDLIKRKIKDERFINLVLKLLNAGYLDLNGERKDSLIGTPQGGIISPILANIYLHELDVFVEGLQRELEKGELKARNPEYRALATRRAKLVREGKTNTPEFRELGKKMRALPSVDVDDPNFIRVRYVRYADDWMIGLCGSFQLAEEIKERVKTFLKEKLHLTLSEEKTRITNTRTEEGEFLGTRIRVGRTAETQKQTISTNGSGRMFKRRSTGWEVVIKAPMDKLIKKLEERGFCTVSGEPIAKGGWQHLDIDQIIELYASTNRGIQNYYRFVDNWRDISRIQYILEYSLAKTLASKLKISVAKVFDRFGDNISFKVISAKGERTVKFYKNTDWKTNRKAFTDSPQIDLVRTAIRMRTRSKLGQPCCVCGSSDEVEMHHVRHIRKMSEKKAISNNFARILRALNRKQVPVCKRCHRKIHRGEYDGLKLSELAYDPRKPNVNRVSG